MVNRLKKYWFSFKTFFILQPLWRKILLCVGFAISGMIAFGTLLILLVWIEIFGPLPDHAELKSIKNPLATEVYSADSVLLGRYYFQERSSVEFNQISPAVINALIATEDVRFYKHHGIDFPSLGRVLFKTILLQNESSGGGSTITQQLAKNLYPRKQYSVGSIVINKIKEGIIAYKLENIYSKEEILTLYLNTVPFGDNMYGIQTASQCFYSTSAKLLNVDQAAVLIGMLKATYAYNPRIFPERALSRRNVVLHQMAKYDFLSDSKKDSLQNIPIKLEYQKITHHNGMASYFRSHIQSELLKWCETHVKENGKPYNLYMDGLKIYTTIESRLQSYAETAVREHMTSLQKQFKSHWGKVEPWGKQYSVVDNAIRKSRRYLTLQEHGLSHDEILVIMKKPVLTTVFTWEGEKEIVMSPIDSVKHHLQFLNTGVLAMSPQTGGILVWVGGIDHHYFQYDHVRESTKRQAGSTFKPIVYAAALEKGVDPCQYVSSERIVFTSQNDWSPENSNEDYSQRYSMTGGLTYSVNTVSVRLLKKAGIDNTIALARKLGISSDIPSYPSIALGTPSISVYEMVRAYAAFANNGEVVEPYYITSIVDHTGKVLEHFTPKTSNQQAMSPENAQLIVHMLKHVVNEGTGARIRHRYKLDNDIAGKTGTTQSNTDGWFMAITPKLVVGTWVGADDPIIRFRSTALGQGANTALPIFAQFYQYVNSDHQYTYLSKAQFAPLSENMQRRVDCELMKSGETWIDKFFGKKNKTEEFEGGEKRGFLKRLFNKKEG